VLGEAAGMARPSAARRRAMAVMKRILGDILLRAAIYVRLYYTSVR